MSVKVESTTDTPEAVMAATGNLATKESEDSAEETEPQQSEEGESSDEEQAEDSETSDQEESDDDSSDSEEDEDSEDEKPSKSKKSRGGFKRRIDKLSKQRAQAEQERDYYREQWLKAQQEGKPKETPRQQSQDLEKPKADDFDDHDSYLEALADYKADQKLKSWEQKQKEERLRQEQQAQTQSFQAKVQEFAKEHDDFQEVIEEVGDIPMSATVQHVILESDNGPALMYALAQDPEQYEAICKMPAIQAARALGKIEASLSKESRSKEPTKPKLTKAPKPPTPISSKASSVGRKDPNNMSFQEFKKWREQQGG